MSKTCKYCRIKEAETQLGTIRLCDTNRFRIWQVKKGDRLTDDGIKPGFYLEDYDGLQLIHYCPNCGRKLCDEQ